MQDYPKFRLGKLEKEERLAKAQSNKSSESDLTWLANHDEDEDVRAAATRTLFEWYYESRELREKRDRPMCEKSK